MFLHAPYSSSLCPGERKLAGTKNAIRWILEKNVIPYFVVFAYW